MTVDSRLTESRKTLKIIGSHPGHHHPRKGIKIRDGGVTPCSGAAVNQPPEHGGRDESSPGTGTFLPVKAGSPLAPRASREV